MSDLFFQERDPVMTQSGFQAVFGGWSHTDPKFPENADQVQLASELTEAMPSAAARVLWPAFLLAGIGAGFAMQRGGRRRLVIGACAGGALAVAATMWVMGFPLEHAYRSLILQDELRKAREQDKPPPTPKKIDFEVKVVTRYTAWFWLAQYAIIVAVGMLGVEWWWHRRQSSEPRSQPAEAIPSGAS
jgi:hypothetical protein